MPVPCSSGLSSALLARVPPSCWSSSEICTVRFWASRMQSLSSKLTASCRVRQSRRSHVNLPAAQGILFAGHDADRARSDLMAQSASRVFGSCLRVCAFARCPVATQPSLDGLATPRVSSRCVARLCHLSWQCSNQAERSIGL